MNLIFTKFAPKSWVSRTKTLLKRRKIHTKSRPISTKHLAQQQKKFNYAHEYKALQIQKQLDRRTYASQHINQLIEQIFYPDITIANEEAARIHLEASMLQDHDYGQGEKGILGEIGEKVLATDLIQFYRARRDEMEGEDFVALWEKFVHYFRKRDRIKQTIQRKWQKTNKTMKTHNPTHQPKKCPYIFLDRHDTFHYQPWNQMIEDLCSKFAGVQTQDEKFVEAVVLFAELVSLTEKAVHSVPLGMWEVFQGMLGKLGDGQIGGLDMEQTHKIIKAISVKNSIRLPAYHTIPTPSPSPSQTIPTQIKSTLVLKLLQSPELTPKHLENILNILKYGILPFTDEIATKLKEAVLKNGILVDLGFQRVVDLLALFVRRGAYRGTSQISPTPTTSLIVMDRQFVQLVKFDALRKTPKAINIKYLFKCMELVNGGYLQSPAQSTVPVTEKVYGQDLLEQCASTIMSKYTTKTFLASKSDTNPSSSTNPSMLSYLQVQKLATIFFSNNLTNPTLLQFLSSELVKLRHSLSLSQLTSTVLQIFILGYRSHTLARILYEEQRARYADTRKKVEAQEVGLLEGEVDEKLKARKEYRDTGRVVREEVVGLEEDLVITLWMLVMTWGQSNKNGKSLPVPLEDLMKIYPLSISSSHPLAHECIQNLNTFTKTHKILWPIKTPSGAPKRPTSQLRHRLDKYYQYQHPNPVIKVLRMEAEQSCQFVQNYCEKEGKFVPEIWSQCKIYGIGEYLRYLGEDGVEAGNYFNRDLKVNQDIVNLRQGLVKSYKQGAFQQKLRQNSKQKQQKVQQKVYKMD